MTAGDRGASAWEGSGCSHTGGLDLVERVTGGGGVVVEGGVGGWFAGWGGGEGGGTAGRGVAVQMRGSR